VPATVGNLDYALDISSFMRCCRRVLLLGLRGGPVARLSVDGAEFWVAEDSVGEDERESPPVRMILSVIDPDALFPQALFAGATELYPITEAHGWRIGRVVDPLGHHWEIGRPLN